MAKVECVEAGVNRKGGRRRQFQAGKRFWTALAATVAAIVIAIPASVSAAKVEPETAQGLAQRFAESRQRQHGRPGRTEVRLKHAAKRQNQGGRLKRGTAQQGTANDVSYYVFNINEAQNGGFVIVAADDAVKPVLGYSDNGKYDETDLPPNFAYYMEYLQSQIEWAQENGVAQSAEVGEEWESYLSGDVPEMTAFVEPLIQTKWGQSAPYYNMCPMSGGTRTLTGCVATAMAQIMYYHKHPASATTVPSEAYTTSTLGLSMNSVNLGNFDWNSMQPTYPGGTNATQQNAVAKLMFHAGLSVKMDYDPDGSGAFATDVPAALTKYFGYDNSIKFKRRAGYDNASWENMLKEQLDDRKPVLYRGEGSAGGHAFVCDGYNSDGKFHFNWGWSGGEDGYFALSLLNPTPYNFSNQQMAVIDIKPDVGGTPSYEMAHFIQFGSTKTTVMYNEQFTLNFTAYNAGVTDIPTFTLMAALVNDNNGNIVENVGYKMANLPMKVGAYRSIGSFNCNVSTAMPGSYKLKMFVSFDNGTTFEPINCSFPTNFPTSLEFTVLSEAPTYTYTISASTLTSFGSLQTPYAQPASQTVTVTNTGTGAVTLTQPAATKYDIGTLSTTSLATTGATATFTVRPKPGLAVGSHNETITISGTDGASATVSAIFAVTEAPTPVVSAYTITFNANGGTVSQASGTTGVGGKLLSLPAPTRSGYSFEGWYTVSASTGGTQVTANTVFTANATIYARWALATYTIVFDANGGTVSPYYGTTGTGGRLSSLPASAKRTGYTFDGWHTEEAGGTRVTTSTVFSAGATVYAHWKPVRYAITYNLNGGTVTPANPAGYTIETADFALNNPTRVAYTFAGWTGANGTTKQADVYIWQGSTGDKSYTANWTGDVYTITFDPNGGNVTRETANTVTGGKLSSLPAPAAMAGYTFDGWYTEWAGGVKVTTSYVFGGDAVVYARWAPIRYTITYNLNNGTVSSANPTSYTVETAGFALNNPTRTAYTFDGWTVANGTAKQEDGYVESGSMGNKTYTANWTPNIYTITFDANGGRVAQETARTVTGGKLSSLPAPAMAGYAFEGWYTSPTGGVKVATSYVFGDDAVVYARWTPVHTVWFNANGGTVSLEAGSTGAGGKLSSLPVPTRAGYAFEGWYTERTGGVNVTTGTVFSDDASVYARWSVSVAVTSPDRVVPGGNPGEEAVLAPVPALTAEFTAGPNPVGKSLGKVSFFRQGNRIASAPLLVIYDASGNVVKKIGIADKAAACGNDRRAVGSWNLKDAKGRPVPEGTYLVRGTVKTAGGKRERVSVAVSVR
jgi:uncharacterized repeat protein (TIGR02543 family)